MQKTRLFLIIIFTVLIAGNIYLSVQLLLSKAELKRANNALYSQRINEKTISFAKLFVEKVLQGAGEIVFEDRLKLENSVRDINDQEIFDQWQRFVKSENDQQAQREAGILFTMLLDKIIE